MVNREKIDNLLLDIRELERLVAGMRNAEVYPVSFFGQTFDLTHKILKDIHALETIQIEALRKQMEEHQALIQSIPSPVVTPIPMQTESEIPVPVSNPIPAKAEPEEAETAHDEPEIRQAVTETAVTEVSQKEIPVEEPIVVQPAPAMAPAEVIEPEIPAGKETPTKPDPIPVSTERTGLFLNDLLEKKNLSDFRKAFSLNDRFRFRRELFGGDEARMNKAISDLNDLHSYEESVAYLNNELKWNIEDEAVADFIKLLEKRFL